MIITSEIEIHLFEEFIQFAFNEFYISGWRDRMNQLREGEYNYIIIGMDDSKIKYMLSTIPELLNEGLDYKEVIMSFAQNLTAFLWFNSWLNQRYPNIFFWKKGFCWNKDDDFKKFVNMLSFEELNRIIDSEIMLK
jgi:hypothetical protein